MIQARRSRQNEWWTISLASLMLLGGGFFFSLVLSAQSQQSSSAVPASALNDQQKAGRRLFMQNCSYCHLLRNSNRKSTAEGTAFGGGLKGLFQGERPRTEQAVKALILGGVPKKMPGFQYGLEPEEIDSIIAYLKTL